jgi:hypothetical protein
MLSNSMAVQRILLLNEFIHYRFASRAQRLCGAFKLSTFLSLKCEDSQLDTPH